MGKLQNYINKDEIEEQAKDNKKVDLKYVGPLSHLKGKKGQGYFIASENQWYFEPKGIDETYRVKVENLDFER